MMFVEFARNAATYVWSTGQKTAGRPRGPRLGLESLERRELLAADLSITELSSDGQDIVVKYDVSNQNASAFAIGIFKSTDGITAGAQLQSVQVTSSTDYAQGSHTLTIDPDFTDSADDYYIVAVIDIYDAVSESNETNNNEAYEGGIFVTGDGVIQIHGTAGADSVTVDGGTSLDVKYNGWSESYAPTTITGVSVRTHGGNDDVDGVYAGLLDMQVHGGDGDDTIIGGRGADSFYGGDGDDVMLGRSGDDALYGEQGHDEIGGGHGDDSIYGDDGFDMLHGDGGQDLIDGGDDSDVIYGGDAADDIFAGDGDDYVYATNEDDVSLGTGNDTQFEDEDGNNGYGSAYGSRPEVTGLGVIHEDGMWSIVGSVSDADEDLAGFTVTISGLLNVTIEVGDDEVFGEAFDPPETQYGWIYATITDSDGNVSDEFWCRVS